MAPPGSPMHLVIDLVTLLDRSIAGADATKALERQWKAVKDAPEDQQRELLGRLEQKRDGLRKQLLDRARPIIAELAKKKGAQVVLEKSAVVWTEAEDITTEASARVDALGPLKV